MDDSYKMAASMELFLESESVASEVCDNEWKIEISKNGTKRAKSCGRRHGLVQ